MKLKAHHSISQPERKELPNSQLSPFLRRTPITNEKGSEDSIQSPTTFPESAVWDFVLLQNAAEMLVVECCFWVLQAWMLHGNGIELFVASMGFGFTCQNDSLVRVLARESKHFVTSKLLKSFHWMFEHGLLFDKLILYWEV
ncbi:hypothetical protein HAX54_043227 [Datura stramonium]|uniref:Uncharacterized protein n=1 Tax=Datura stramonium TaxID=4076 RepID=A0ABS8SMV0_DATST|nr:hypothetical protein [Datura stramonium]